MPAAGELYEKAPLPRKLIKRLQQQPQQTAWAIAEQEWDVGHPCCHVLLIVCRAQSTDHAFCMLLKRCRSVFA